MSRITLPNKPRKSPRPTLRTVAERAGVSVAVVSYSFNHPDRVAKKTRERVLKAAAELGYSGPDPAARALRTGRTGVIAFHFTPAPPGEELSPRVGRVLEGALAACAERGISITIPTGSARPACDGAIILGPGLDGLEIETPYVRVGPYVEDDESLVAPDPSAIDEALAAITEQGHSRLTILTAEALEPWFARRATSWPGEVQVITAPSESHENGRQAGHSLLESVSDRPTAIMVAGDHLALGFLTATSELRTQIPQDFSFVAIGNSESFTPKVAGVRIPQRELGTQAVAYLSDLLNGGVDGRPPLVPSEYLPGATLGPPPSS